jgi:hypothetical protein
VALATACGGSASSPTGSASGSATGGGTRLTTSHNAGRDCLGCHRNFAVAGTLYRADGSAYPGASVRLTTAAAGGGAVVLSVSTDASGNFYTTQAVGFGSGLYADAAGTGARRSKTAPVTSGACNSCHDAQNRLRAD